MSLESIPVSRFMTKNVKTETEDQNIQAVCRTMNENNIGSIVDMSLGDKDQTCRNNHRKRHCAHNRPTKSISSTYANKRTDEQTSYHTIA